MDAGDIAIVATLTIGFVAVMLTLFAVMRQGNSELRAEVRETRSQISETRNETSAEIRETRSETSAEIREARTEIRELAARFGERISDVEREQARLEGANGTLAEVMKQQSHTHDAPAD